MRERAVPDPIQLPQCVQVASLGCLYAPALSVVVPSLEYVRDNGDSLARAILARGGVGDVSSKLRQVILASANSEDASEGCAAFERGVIAGFGHLEAHRIYAVLAHARRAAGTYRGVPHTAGTLVLPTAAADLTQIVRQTLPTRI